MDINKASLYWCMRKNVLELWNTRLLKNVQDGNISLPRYRDNASYENYEVAKREATDGQKNIYKLAMTRKLKTREINSIKCIKDEDQRALIKEVEIKDRWKSYFDIIFNGSHTRNWSKLCSPNKDRY